MTPEIMIGIYISVISLVISILSIFISWCAFDRDKNDLKITAEFLLESDQGTAFKVHLVNRGRRPINIEKILLRLKSGKELIPLLNTPKVVLDENEPSECWFPLFHYLDKISSPLEIKQAEVYDSHGKKYSFPFLRLKKQILKEWTPENNWFNKNKPSNLT